MTQEQIEQGNKLIAEFMGATQDSDDLSDWWGGIMFPHGYDRTFALKYHSSWDWLMPVVEKILKIAHENMLNEWECEFANRFLSCNITAIYLLCIEFIKWHNANK